MLEIIQGEQQTFTIDLTSKKNNGRPFDLTGNTEITVCFKANTTIVTKTKTAAEVSVVGDPALGVITGNLEVADTEAMTPLTDGAIEIVVDFGGGNIKKAQLINAFKVTAKIC